MGGLQETQRGMNVRDAGGITERKKKKKKKKIRREDGAAIAKIGEASKESGSHQITSSLDSVLDCIDSRRKLKKRRRLRGLQKRELPFDEASSEKEKQSLLAWVEMCMEPLCNTNSTQDFHGEIGCFAKRISLDGSPNGRTTPHSVAVCVGNNLSGPFCNGDVFAAARNDGRCDHVPNAHAFEVDHESHGCGKKPLSNGHNCQANHHTKRCSSEAFHVQSSHEGLTHAAAVNYKKCHLLKHADGSSQARGQSSIVPSGEISSAGHTSTHAHHGSLLDASGHGESECSRLAITKIASQRGLSGGHARSGEDNSSCASNTHNNKRKREDDKVLQYVLKRSVVVHPSLSEPFAKSPRTTKTVVVAWGRNIPVTLTSEARTVQEWISSQNGNLFGLDVEWRPNRAKGQKNKVALLQLCNESECLIIQMLFLDKKPQALCKLLSDPSKSLAGVGVLADGRRLLHDYGLECQGGVELTTLAVERLKRDELRNAGLKVLVQEVLGLKMDKPKKVTLSNWAKVKLDRVQINYACIDAWASFALSRKLLVDM